MIPSILKLLGFAAGEAVRVIHPCNLLSYLSDDRTLSYKTDDRVLSYRKDCE